MNQNSTKSRTRATPAAPRKRNPGAAKKVAAVLAERGETDQLQLVRQLIAKVGGEFVTGSPRASLGDLLRLLQMEKDLAPAEAKEIVVRWVDPPADK